jgi:hypothetical protein
VSSPTVEPIALRIMRAYAAVLAQISPDNGFYNTVAGAGVEPLAFDAGDSYPQIVVQLESSNITDNKAAAVQDSVVLAAHGFVQTDSASSYATAMTLLDDMTRVTRSITRKTFALGTPPAAGYENSNPSLVTKWDIEQHREIVASDIAQGFFEVIVRVACEYRDFSAPMSGV